MTREPPPPEWDGLDAYQPDGWTMLDRPGDPEVMAAALAAVPRPPDQWEPGALGRSVWDDELGRYGRTARYCGPVTRRRSRSSPPHRARRPPPHVALLRARGGRDEPALLDVRAVSASYAALLRIDGRWHHVVVTVGDTIGAVRWYVDGERPDSAELATWSGVELDETTIARLALVMRGEPVDEP